MTNRSFQPVLLNLLVQGLIEKQRRSEKYSPVGTTFGASQHALLFIWLNAESEQWLYLRHNVTEFYSQVAKTE